MDIIEYWGLKIVGIFWGWILQGYFTIGSIYEKKKIIGIFIEWALQGYLLIRHCRDI